MLIFNVTLNGNDDDAQVLQDCLADWDDAFEDDEPSLEVEVDDLGLYGHDDICEVEELAEDIANALPDSSFTITGYIDTSELGGEYMDFLIEYSNHTLVSKNSGWYIYMHANDFDTYDDFAEAYTDEDGQPRFTEEQYEEFKTGEYFILESGDGDCVSKVPLKYETTTELDN